MKHRMMHILILIFLSAHMPATWGAEQTTELDILTDLQDKDQFEEFLFTDFKSPVVSSVSPIINSVISQINTETQGEEKKYYCPNCLVDYLNKYAACMDRDTFNSFSIKSLSDFKSHLKNEHSIEENELIKMKITCKNDCQKNNGSKVGNNKFSGYYNWYCHFCRVHGDADIQLDFKSKQLKRKVKNTAAREERAKKRPVVKT